MDKLQSLNPSPVIPAGAPWPTVQKAAHQFNGEYGGDKWYFPTPAHRDQFIEACAAAGVQLKPAQV